jgi:NAD(P)-dependent dehydrogenase (short-subunit alcohol dehydrogenase family)
MHNKNILIVGGTKGVAKDLIFSLLEKGCRVTFCGRDNEAANKIINKIHIKDRNSIQFIHTNISKISDCRNLVISAINHFGEINGIVIYSGITPLSSLEDCNEDLFDDVFNINIKAPFFICQDVIKSFKRVGGGSIVLIGTSHAFSGEIDRAAYAISKGALYTLSEHISHNYSQNSIRCNYLTMGWTPTEGEIKFRETQGMNEQQLRDMASSIIPMKRMVENSDLIPGIIYLLSDESSMVTGSNLRITGGEYI